MTSTKKMIIEIDGVVCEHVDPARPDLMAVAKPIPGARERINQWHDEGCYVCFFTARPEEHRAVTERWLHDHGIPYHQLIFNKPPGGDYHYIDDLPVRATRFRGRFSDFVRVKKDILVFREVDDPTNRRILIADSIAEEGIDYLRGLPDITVDVKTGLSPDELDAIISRYAGLIVRSATKVPKGLIDRGTNLRVIGRAGSGLDSIDVEHAQQKGIIVLNVPQALSVSVAEHTMCLILALCRHTPQAHASIRAGGWEKGKFKGAELYKKTLGILGLGGIGQMVAARAQGFGMQVIGYDNAFYSESFEQVIRQADILTIHVPLTPQTRHMIGEHEIAMMKDGVRIINCARGGIIDEAALYRALVSGKVAGAALDVFEQEPPAGNPLLTLDNVIITPHIGASTKEAQVSVGMTIAKKVAGILLSTGTTESVARP